MWHSPGILGLLMGRRPSRRSPVDSTFMQVSLKTSTGQHSSRYRYASEIARMVTLLDSWTDVSRSLASQAPVGHRS